MNSVNIFGTSVDTSSFTTQNISLNNYVRKSGDILSGNIDLGFHRILHLGAPEQPDDACALKIVNERYGEAIAYTDRLETSLLHKGGEDGAEVVKIGTKNNQNVELIKNAEVFLSLDDNVKVNADLDLQRHKIINVLDPVSDNDVATKKFISAIKTELSEYIERLDNTCLHRLGDGGPGITGIFLGSNTNIPVNLVCNRQRYVLLFQDSITIMTDIDMTNHKITNVRNPDDALDCSNKRYVDIMCRTKNFVGYIPVNPHLYGFVATTSVPVVTNNVLANIFNDDLNSVWEIPYSNNTRFFLRCPDGVLLWKVALTFQLTDELSRMDVKIYGCNDNNFTNLTDITSSIIRRINAVNFRAHGFNSLKFSYYSIEITREEPSAETLKLIRFQMFVCNG